MSRRIKVRLYSEPAKKYIDYITVGFLNTGELRSYSTENGVGPVLEDNYIVEQYTGLKDKNGDKEIYEGDILETCCGKAEVYFDDELLMYKIKTKHGGTMPLVSKNSKRHFDYEIIGNIHESNMEELCPKE